MVRRDTRNCIYVDRITIYTDCNTDRMTVTLTRLCGSVGNRYRETNYPLFSSVERAKASVLDSEVVESSNFTRQEI